MALTLESLKPIYPKYDYKYTNKPSEACSTYLTERNPFNLLPRSKCKAGSRHASAVGDGKLTTKDVDWKGKSRGLFFHHPPCKVNTICVKLSEECEGPDPVICRERTKTRCTQTRYRESSAQTRSYQPEIAGDKENYQNFEIYQISKLLHGIDPPGEYEGKVVERARRRRKYEKALKMVINDKEKHNLVLEAMEWEDWVAREEDIQGFQMLRMEIVVRMYEEREEKFRLLSEQRISYSADRIHAKRSNELKKINIEYLRGMRMLEAKKQKINRGYRKGNITQEHIDPASDLHAPQMRFGVNPNRRHFIGFRKKFDDRIADLDKQKDERGLESLVCPFSKLRSWAKPKEQMKEVSQRFCSDENLKNLYESLKSLRTISEAAKLTPKCLKLKVKSTQPKDNLKNKKIPHSEVEASRQPKEYAAPPKIFPHEEKPTIEDLTKNLHQRRAKELSSKTAEEISSIVGEFEGSTLGKLLQFLSDELERLHQQKKFQAIHMLAERQRWKREAYEAGLRQKENKQREDLEKLFRVASHVHRDTASMFLESVLEEEFEFTSESLANDKITALAKDIDTEDLDSIRLEGRDKRIFDRGCLRDYFRKQVIGVVDERLKKKKDDQLHEAQFKAIQEELMTSVGNAIADKYKINYGVSIVGEFLDELIDSTVVYDFDIYSPSVGGDDFNIQREIDEIVNKLLEIAVRKPGLTVDFVDATEFQDHLVGEREARAIINKMVKIAVPAERWESEGERIVEQTLSETFNEAIYEVECLNTSRLVLANDKLNEIISQLYKRIDIYKKKSNIAEAVSSESLIYERIPSIRSNFDIFEKKSDSTTEHDDDSIGNASLIERINVDASTNKIDYVDVKKLVKYEPVAVGPSDGRFNIMGQSEKLCINKEDSDALSDHQLSTETMHTQNVQDNQGDIQINQDKISYTSQTAGMVTSKIDLPSLQQDFHPELTELKELCLRRMESYSQMDIAFENRQIPHKKSDNSKPRSPSV